MTVPSPDEFAAEQLRATVAEATVSDRAEHNLLSSLFQVIRFRAAVKPVIIAIDDLSSADPPSARWFNFVARRLDGLPVAMIATLDTDAAGDTAAELASLPYAKMVRPGPLCETCAAEWVAQELGAPLDSELAAACHIVSMGNPQVLRELANRLATRCICPGSPPLDAVLEIGAATLSDTVLDWPASRHLGRGRSTHRPLRRARSQRRRGHRRVSWSVEGLFSGGACPRRVAPDRPPRGGAARPDQARADPHSRCSPGLPAATRLDLHTRSARSCRPSWGPGAADRGAPYVAGGDRRSVGIGHPARCGPGGGGIR